MGKTTEKSQLTGADKMGAPQFRHHTHKQMWADFENDLIEFNSNRPKYKGISSKPENYAWYYRSANKTIATRKRLHEIYEFKIEFESTK